ncbi:hypothetical protein AGMMS49936_06970 [Endomicrobiia bacterium]|nr:hypothetical protein AGMMS49936_06970 [Endomicrobiia bacterium]
MTDEDREELREKLKKVEDNNRNLAKAIKNEITAPEEARKELQKAEAKKEEADKRVEQCAAEVRAAESNLANAKLKMLMVLRLMRIMIGLIRSLMRLERNAKKQKMILLLSKRQCGCCLKKRMLRQSMLSQSM